MEVAVGLVAEIQKKFPNFELRDEALKRRPGGHPSTWFKGLG